MAKVEKRYWIDCYRGTLGEPVDKRNIYDEIYEVAKQGKHLGIKSIDGHSIEVFIHTVADTHIVGEIRKYRNEFLTIANTANKTEKELGST